MAQVVKVLIAGVTLIQYRCPCGQALGFAAKGREGFVSECPECGEGIEKPSSLELTPDTRYEVRFPKAQKAKRAPYPRRAIFVRDKFTCRYCGWQPTDPWVNRELVETESGKVVTNWLSVHHVVPVCSGGAARDKRNLVTACWRCHRKIGTRLHAPDDWEYFGGEPESP